MDPPTLEMGPHYGRHGSYTFYKSFKYKAKGRWRSVSMEKFFFVNISSNSPLCIGEIQLIWTVKTNSYEPLSSVRLYFLPEQLPEGRQHYHGENEVIATEKIILRVKDLLSWIVVDAVSWTAGSRLMSFDVREAKPGVLNSTDCQVMVLSYPKYCRLATIKKRLDSLALPIAGEWAPDAAVCAAAVRTLSGLDCSLSSDVHVLFCRSTFEHPDLDDHEFRCDHLAPNLKGRPRRKQGCVKKESSSNSEEDYVPVTTVSKPPRGRPRKSDVSDAFLRAEAPFLKAVYKFMKDRGTPIHRVPSLGFKKIDLFVFYKTAEKLGGYKQICLRRMWKLLYDKIGGHPGSTSAATCTRKHYERLLLPFEEHLRKHAGSLKVQEDVESATPGATPVPSIHVLPDGSATVLDAQLSETKQDVASLANMRDIGTSVGAHESVQQSSRHGPTRGELMQAVWQGINATGASSPFSEAKSGWPSPGSGVFLAAALTSQPPRSVPNDKVVQVAGTWRVAQQLQQMLALPTANGTSDVTAAVATATAAAVAASGLKSSVHRRQSAAAAAMPFASPEGRRTRLPPHAHQRDNVSAVASSPRGDFFRNRHAAVTSATVSGIVGSLHHHENGKVRNERAHYKTSAPARTVSNDSRLTVGTDSPLDLTCKTAGPAAVAGGLSLTHRLPNPVGSDPESKNSAKTSVSSPFMPPLVKREMLLGDNLQRVHSGGGHQASSVAMFLSSGGGGLELYQRHCSSSPRAPFVSNEAITATSRRPSDRPFSSQAYQHFPNYGGNFQSHALQSVPLSSSGRAAVAYDLIDMSSRSAVRPASGVASSLLPAHPLSMSGLSPQQMTLQHKQYGLQSSQQHLPTSLPRYLYR